METAEATGALVRRLGFATGQVVQELGYDEDVDQALRSAVEEATGVALEDEYYDGAADAVVLWFREGDGDLTDEVMDSLTTLADGGFVVLMTPRPSRDDMVEATDIEDAATTAGLRASGQTGAGADWFATRLVNAGTPRR